MAFPNKYLEDPSWHAKPIKEREKDLMAADPDFAKIPAGKRTQILERAATKYGAKKPTGLLDRAGRDLSIGFRGGASDLAKSVANVGRVIHVPEVVKTGEKYAEQWSPRPSEVAGLTSLPDQVLQGMGAAPATLLKYAPAELAGKYAPVAAGAIGAITAADKGPAEMVKAGVRDAAMFYGLGKTSKLPSRAARAGGGAVVSGATSAVFEGGDPKSTASAAIMGAGFGAMGGKKSEMRAMTPEQAKALLEGGANSITHVKDFVRRSIAPQNRGPQARKEANIIRAHNSEINHQSDIAEYALREASKSFRSMPDEQRMDVIRSIEQPDKYPVDKKMKGFVDTMREIHNGVRDELIEEGSFKDPKTGEKKFTVLKSVKEAIDSGDDAMKSYYTNFFPHLFTDPDKAAEIVRAMYAGKRPPEGPATFTHLRKHATIEDALSVTGEDGKPLLKMITTDPVEAYMLKWREMKRFTAGLRIVKDMEGDGILEWHAPGKRGPNGWVEIKNSKVFRRTKTTESGGQETTAVAWAPEQAARVLNNYLSPGLRGNGAAGGAIRGLMTFNNVLNQAQLGFSAFHLGFTSVDAVTSRAAIGMEQVIQGMREGNLKMAGKGVSSIAKASTYLPAFVENLRTGSKLRKEWLKPGSSGDPEMAKMVGMIEQAGGGLSLDPVYRTDMNKRIHESMRQHGGYLGMLLQDPTAIPKTFLALNEKFGNLILNEFVPRQKLGVFSDMMRFEMERMPEGATVDQIRQAAAKSWDSTDNRMGQLRYDNLFWEKWIKDAAMITFRSVGWNIGTLRELGGGASDWGKLGKAFLKGTNREFTHRMAYTLAMPYITGLMGSMIHYAYNGTGPETMMDRFFPRTGRKDEFGRDERLSIPSYVKDVYHMSVAAGDLFSGAGGAKGVGLVGAKIHSTWGVLADMLMNRDFYNTQIANPEDPMIKRGFDYTQYLLKQYSPFSWTNIARERKLGFPISEQVGTFVGFIPAPSDIKKTPAERLATEIMKDNLRQGSNTREQRDLQDGRRELERRIRTQDNWQQFAQEKIDAGLFSEQDVVYAMDRASGLPLDRAVDRGKLEDVPKIWHVATSEEKRRLKPIIAQKLERGIDKLQELPASHRQRLSQQLLEIMQENIPEAPPGR